MPVYNSDERWLIRAIESVTQQVYPNWELCIADDASTELHVIRIIEHFRQIDPRIKLIRREVRGHIAAASNSALLTATGDYIALLDHDDELSIDALFEVVRLINRHPEADLIYSDEDKIDTTGHRIEPFFKPDWSPFLLLNINYITHFAVIRRHVVNTVGGFRDAYIGSQDHDLFLRVTAQTDHVFHIPKILYSWRKAATSAALSADIKNYAYEASFRAVENAVAVRTTNASVSYGSYPPFIRVRFAIADDPLISIVVIVHTSKDLEVINNLRRRTGGQKFEIVVVTTNHRLKLKYGTDDCVRLVHYNKHLVTKLLQEGAKSTLGDYLVFMQQPSLPIDSDWLTSLLEYAQLSTSGCVGAKILTRHHLILEAGMALGINGDARAVGKGIADVPQLMFYLNLKDAIREVSAVSASCMMIKSSTFWRLGGFDVRYDNSLFDADLCLKAATHSLRTIYMPYARMVCQSRILAEAPSEYEIQLFQSRWQTVIAHEPFYNVNLTRKRLDMAIREPDE